MVQAPTRLVALRQSFSFHIGSTDAALIERRATNADAVVVRGSAGPRVVAGMRSNGWRGTVLFDGAGYEKREIAKRLGVQRQTAVRWHYRQLLPPQRWTVSGSPAWDWAEIDSWARATGRRPPTQPAPGPPEETTT